MAKAQNTLRKKDRLKSRKSINALFEEGKTIKAFPLVLKYRVLEGNSYGLKAAFVVPKRQIRLAVTRNKVKRRIKEAYRTLNAELKTVLHQNQSAIDLIIIYRSSEVVDFKALQEKIIVILQRLTKELNSQELYEEKN